MGKTKIDAAGLFLALVAGVFIFAFLRPFGWITGLGGLALLFVLFAYDHEGVRSGFQTLAFSSVCGFAVMLIVAAFFESGAFGNPSNIRIYTDYLPIAWVCATFAIAIIDRARMGSRFQESLGPRSLGIPPRAIHVQPPPEPNNRAGSVSGRVRVPPPPEPQPAQPEPQPVQAAPAESTSERTAMYEAAPPPPPVPQPEPQPEDRNQSGNVNDQIPAQPPSAEAPAPVPILERAVPVPHRKEASIYINLVGEGIAVLRPVRAEHMGKDFYLITEPMPENEAWQFTTGQIVRCKKKNLSHGKGLVAIEEAPRAS